MIVTTQIEWDALPDSFDTFTVIEIRSKETILIRSNPKNSSVVAYHSSSVVAYDSSSVRAYHSSSVRAYHSSSVEAYHSSSVVAYDFSSVEAYDFSSVEAYHSSSVEAWDFSSVEAYHSSSVEAWEKSTVHARNNKPVTAGDNVTIYNYRDIKDNVEPTCNVIHHTEFIAPTFQQWLDRGYVVADGIRLSLVDKKSLGEIAIYRCKDWKKEESFVAQKGDKFSHGKTPEEAVKDLRYKISDRDKSYYENWKLTDVKSVDEIIEAYRVITGACSHGTKLFCESRSLKDEMTLSEAIKETEGQYGHEEFKDFLGDRA